MSFPGTKESAFRKKAAAAFLINIFHDFSRFLNHFFEIFEDFSRFFKILQDLDSLVLEIF